LGGTEGGRKVKLLVLLVGDHVDVCPGVQLELDFGVANTEFLIPGRNTSVIKCAQKERLWTLDVVVS
jgi:hypothetical protein